MRHVEFAKAFARARGVQDIWVYDNYQLVPGSPFQTKAGAGRSVGVNQTTRFLDTKKLFLNRYGFYTKSQFSEE